MPDTPHRPPHPAAPQPPASPLTPTASAAPQPTRPAAQAATRRHVVQGLGTGAAALVLATATPAAQAAPAQDTPGTPDPAPAHPARPEAFETPHFFSPDAFAFLCAACERIFPADDHGPGARALGVPHFIDRQMDTPWGRGELWYRQGPHRPDAPANLGYQLPYSPQQIYQSGLAGAMAWVQQTHQAAFETLPPEQQDDILGALEQNATQFAAQPFPLPAATFFEQLRSDTIEGAFADPLHGGNRNMAGWLMMGFPGARGDYMDWVDRYDTAYPYGPVAISGERTEHG